MNSNSEELELQCRALTQMVEEFLYTEKWRFELSASFVTPTPTIIYDSEWCRVKFVWQGWDTYTGNSVAIYYGRSHAPNDKLVMALNNMNCYCWHDIRTVLNFLDGLSPQEAVDRLYLGNWPNVAEQFKMSELGISLEANQPEWLIRIHSVIWEHYGLRLFALFDLRHPETWEQYVQFIEQYHIIAKSIKLSGYPPQGQIC